MTIMNRPKKKHSLNNLHIVVNQHMIVNSLHYGVTNCNRQLYYQLTCYIVSHSLLYLTMYIVSMLLVH